MFPEDPVIFLVQAHGILQPDDLTAAVGQLSIKILDLSEAVAPEVQRIGQHADPVLAHVKGVLAAVIGMRVTVGDHHVDE